MSSSIDTSSWPKWRERLRKIIYEADTPIGKQFDIILFWLILGSVVVVMLESVEALHFKYGSLFWIIEWIFTIFFTFEYVARILTVQRPKGYVLSFFGIVDLLAILPTYIALFIGGAQSLMVIRTLRLLRVFRVLKLVNFLKEAHVLQRSLAASRHKIGVFLLTVFILVIIMGTIIYIIEPHTIFTSIPQSVYWAIVTLTTVGYGDIAPTTVVGKIFASVIMIMGYSIIAVPTGIVTSELTKDIRKTRNNTHACPDCSLEGHDDDAKFCKYCGSSMDI